MHSPTDQPYYISLPLVKKNMQYFFKEIKKKSVKNTKNNRYTSCYMKNTTKKLSNHIFIIISSSCTIAIHNPKHQVLQTSG